MALGECINRKKEGEKGKTRKKRGKKSVRVISMRDGRNSSNGFKLSDPTAKQNKFLSISLSIPNTKV